MLKHYGRVLLEPGKKSQRWIVKDLAPHVAVAFKRLFPKAAQAATEHALADSDDTRADLHWFMQRYPLECQHMGMLKAGATAVANRAAKRGEILSTEWRPGPITGFREGKAPYLYQSQAARIAIDQGGLLLADEVGLGKTVACLAALAMGAPMPAAVVVQTNLAIQWKRKIEYFTHFRVHIIDGLTPYTLPQADIYIFKYSNLSGWIDFIANFKFKSVFYDEIQELRHGTETARGRSAAVLSGRAKFRMGLTATATYNYGDEIHTIMQFLNGDLLGERDEFIREWCRAGREVIDPDALGAFLKETGWMLRRTEDDPEVASSLPKPNIIPLRVAWDDRDADDDAAIIRALALQVTTGNFQTAGRAARELDMHMRQMTGVAKARSVANLVKLLLRDVERVLIAGWHREVYRIWHQVLEEYEPAYYTGSETPEKKDRAVQRFTVGRSRVMFMSLRSAAGLDGLQQYCKTIVVGELDWSPQVHHQLIGRLRRPGQEDQVDAYFPYVDEGSDPVLMEINGVKSDQARGIHDPGVMKAPRLSDGSRIKKLAEHVLQSTADAKALCGICGGATDGVPRHIIPLSDAARYPEGPERDALYGADNLWFLCKEHRTAGLPAS